MARQGSPTARSRSAPPSCRVDRHLLRRQRQPPGRAGQPAQARRLGGQIRHLGLRLRPARPADPQPSRPSRIFDVRTSQERMVRSLIPFRRQCPFAANCWTKVTPTCCVTIDDGLARGTRVDAANVPSDISAFGSRSGPRGPRLSDVEIGENSLLCPATRRSARRFCQGRSNEFTAQRSLPHPPSRNAITARPRDRC
jgi:hypothetical protein